MILEEPFFGFLAFKLTLLPDPECETFWTDGVHMGFNPAYAEERSFEECIALCCEEVMHNADGHGWRGVGRELSEWQICCDLAIMPILVASGKKIPADSAYDPQYSGKSPEWIYAERQRQRQQQGGQQARPQGQPSASKTPGQGQSQNPQPGKKPDDSQSQPSPNQDRQQPRKRMSGGEVRPPPPGVDREELRCDWERSVLQAAAIAQAQGKLPAGMERIVDKIKNPAIDWKAALRRFVQRCAKSDYSWRRPNRRYVAQGFYLPSIQSEIIPPMAIYWDTSGSRDSQKAREECMAESIEIFNEARPEKLYMIYGDAIVQRVDVFEPGDEIKFRPMGGGGTRFEPIFEYIEAGDSVDTYGNKDLQPIDLPIACLIGITDLYGSFPKHEPVDYPVLWAATTNAAAPFGEILRLNQGR